MSEENIETCITIYENLDKGQQINVTISNFRGVDYLGIRKYYLSFDEGFVPSKEGVSIPYELVSSLELLKALLSILPLNECRTILESKIASGD